MILVINLNASVDKKYVLEDIEKGKVMRVKKVENTPGGKGIHVANVTTILNESCMATGFLGGKTGEFIEESLKDYGIKNRFIKIEGETRECLAIITEDSVQTELLEPGPKVSEKEQDDFMLLYKELIEEAEVIVASGSIPRNVSNDYYKELIEVANKKNKKFLLDTSGEALREGIKAKPYFIKPNKDEIEFLTGRRISTIEDGITEIKNLQDKGIPFVAISLGEEGSVVGYHDKFYKVTVPRIKTINPVGSGDSFVAGVAIAIKRGYDIKDTLKIACACGTANAMEQETGFVTESVVDELINKIIVEEI